MEINQQLALVQKGQELYMRWVIASAQRALTGCQALFYTPHPAPQKALSLSFPPTHQTYSERVRTLSKIMRPTGTQTGVQGQAGWPLSLHLPVIL